METTEVSEPVEETQEVVVTSDIVLDSLEARNDDPLVQFSISEKAQFEAIPIDAHFVKSSLVDNFPIQIASDEESQIRVPFTEVQFQENNKNSISNNQKTAPDASRIECSTSSFTDIPVYKEVNDAQIKDIINQIEDSLSRNSEFEQFTLESLVNNGLDSVISKKKDEETFQTCKSSFTVEKNLHSSNDNDNEFELIKDYEEEYVYLEHIPAPEVDCFSPLQENTDYEYVLLDIHVDKDYHTTKTSPTNYSVRDSLAQTSHYDSNSKDIQNYTTITSTGRSQTQILTDTKFCSKTYSTSSSFENKKSHESTHFDTGFPPSVKPRTKLLRPKESDEKSSVEIPVVVAKDKGKGKQPEQIQSKLTDIKRLNLDLDKLVSREEHIYELESKNKAKKTPESNELANASLYDNLVSLQSPAIANDSDNKRSNEGFDLIKVSIVNKRPVSPAIEEIINGSDEETYLDKSLGINDDFNSKFEDNKRLSSLDPSLSYEHESSCSPSHSFHITNTSSLRLTNPFSSEVTTKYQTKSSAPTANSRAFKVNPFKERSDEQLINVDKLNSYKYQYEIHPNKDNTGVIKVKDISMVGISTPCQSKMFVEQMAPQINMQTEIQIDYSDSKGAFKEDVKVSRGDRSKRVGVATVESSKPHVVERRFYSEEELVFNAGGKEEAKAAGHVTSSLSNQRVAQVEELTLRRIKSRDTKSKPKPVETDDLKEQKGKLLFVDSLLFFIIIFI